MQWAIFPSGNSEAAQVCVNAWRKAGWKVAVLVDEGQPLVDCDLLHYEPNYSGTAAAYNKLLARIGDWEIVACVNDDMFPNPCSAADAALVMRALGGNHVIQATGDWYEAMAWCCPSPIMDKKFAESMSGKPWHEGYYHLFVDEELRTVALHSGRYAEVPTLRIEHRHKSRGHADLLPPEKRAKNNARHAADRQLFEQRKRAGFPRC